MYNLFGLHWFYLIFLLTHILSVIGTWQIGIKINADHLPFKYQNSSGHLIFFIIYTFWMVTNYLSYKFNKYYKLTVHMMDKYFDQLK